MSKITFLALIAISFSSYSAHADQYKPNRVVQVTIANGSAMPISPGALFTSVRSQKREAIGNNATAGFVQLCQTGDPSGKIAELKADQNIKAIVNTQAPIFPGESKTIEIAIDERVQSLNFEAMYGKSKDACAVVGINRLNLLALSSRSVEEIIEFDRPFTTGAFNNPALPAGSLDGLCNGVSSAPSCLRSLSNAQNGNIAAFNGYLPSVLDFLESKYGASEAHSLQIPTGGAIQFTIKLAK